MKVVRVSELSVGQTLGQVVRNRRGQVLLSAGARLTSTYISRLQAMGFSAVYIQDADTSDITAPQVLPDAERQQLETHMSDAFDAVSRLADDNRKSAGRSDGESFGATNHASRALVAETTRSLSTLAKHGEEMIARIAEHDVLLGLNSLKSHDNYTFQHSIDVAIVGVLLARKLGWDAKRVRAFAIGCLLHDVGKVFIDTAILTKSSPLTEAETAIVRTHPLLGYNLIKTTTPALGLLVPQVALQHHERQDGLGYPRALRGSNQIGVRAGAITELRWAPGKASPSGMIHDFGALAAVADVYDALSSDRPYRAGYHPSRALEAIAQMSGTQLNEEAVEVLRNVIPPFPVCSEVRVLTGRFAGHTGVIARVPEGDIGRPVVRVLSDAAGKKIDAAEVDLAVERDVRLEPMGRAVNLSLGDEGDGIPNQKTSAAPPAWYGPTWGSGAPLPPAVKEFLGQFDLDALENVA